MTTGLGPSAEQPGGTPAPLWRRAAATVCEIVPILLAAAALVAVILLTAPETDTFEESLEAPFLALFVIALVPVAVFVQSVAFAVVEGRGRATFGQRILGIRVIRHDGGNLGVGRALARRFLAGLVGSTAILWLVLLFLSLVTILGSDFGFARVISMALFAASFFVARLDWRRRTWYDLLTGAAIVRGSAPVEREASTSIGTLPAPAPGPGVGAGVRPG